MDIQKIISQMTLEEKASICSGHDFWHTAPIERLGIPKIMVSDGPHGLKKQIDPDTTTGITESVKAVCFPTACALASSFDKDLIRTVGEALGEECQAEDVAVILGPAVNIKRSPLCGRNFEYFSEDPYLASEMAASHVEGVQSKNVGTSIKHFLANNQEHRRNSYSSEIDERTLREIYLAAFETAVVKSKPWTVMCSYNRINGVYASENEEYLTRILRNEWGFDGFVVSDWGAVNDRVKGLAAGLDLEMPSSHGLNREKLINAVKNNTLDEAVLDLAVERILNIVFRYHEHRDSSAVFDREKHHEIARKVCEESIVLLKNDGILPLKKSAKLAFIGKFAKKPRYQGGGSSHINSFKTIGALEAVSSITEVLYAKGYETNVDQIDEALIKEACEAAKASEVAVIFAGLPDLFESEGFDRKHMSLPNCQNRLIEEVCSVQPNTVVVLHNGSPVEMPWVNKVRGILEVYLGGQAVGEATVNVLFGATNPCGKLAESFPIKLQDNPSYLFYTGEGNTVEYREGVFVGYRYYDKKNMEVLFPFGHGLSYTTFEYSNIKLSKASIKDTDTLAVSIDVTNTGALAGKEIVQLYVAAAPAAPGGVIRPEKELKGFQKISLEPGETKTVNFELDKRSFAYYNTQLHDWYVESGSYEILIAKSSRNIACRAAVQVDSTVTIPVKYHINSTFGEIVADPRAKEIAAEIIERNRKMNDIGDSEALGEATKDMVDAMFNDTPLRTMLSFGYPHVKEEEILELLQRLNS